MTDIIACSKQWFFRAAQTGNFPLHEFHCVNSREELTMELIGSLQPRFIFFPHWNWKVPESIWSSVECVVFHIAPLPAGRGGSPIQNLIKLGHASAPVNSLQMTDQLDSGPIYCSNEISLEGSLREIFRRAAPVIQKQILWIQENEPVPVAQEGKPTYFLRLGREENEIFGTDSLETIWDNVRMVDAEDYAPAFLTLENFEIQFSNVSREEGDIVGTFRIGGPGSSAGLPE